MTPPFAKYVNRRTVGLALSAFGGGVILAALLAIMARLGTPFIWNEVAHEDGVRTFGATFLYFEHAVRELPGDLMLGLVIGGALAYACPLAPAARRRANRRAQIRIYKIRQRCNTLNSKNHSRKRAKNSRLSKLL